MSCGKITVQLYLASYFSLSSVSLRSPSAKLSLRQSHTATGVISSTALSNRYPLESINTYEAFISGSMTTSRFAVSTPAFAAVPSSFPFRFLLSFLFFSLFFSLFLSTNLSTPHPKPEYPGLRSCHIETASSVRFSTGQR